MPPKDRVFSFHDPVDFLKFELRERQKENPRFSLRAWARRVGYKNPSYLSHVLSRKRRLKPNLAEKLAADLKLEGRPRRYFETIVLGNSGRSERERRTYQEISRGLRPRKMRDAAQISPETFSVIAEWYHVAILEMTQLADFEPSVEFIFRRLGGKVRKRLIGPAIDRLVRAGLLENRNGSLARAGQASFVMEGPAPSEAVRAYHREMADLAKAAIDAQPAAERDLFGTTLAFRKANLERARQILREAHRQLRELAERGTGEELYHLNTQLFRLTAGRRKRDPRR